MKTVAERMAELKTVANQWSGDHTIWHEMQSGVAQHLTQQAAEAQIALNEAVQAEHNSWSSLVDQLKAEEARLAKEVKEYEDLAFRLRADIASITCDRRNLTKEVEGLKKELATYHTGERGFLAASCKDCGANLQPEDLIKAIKHKPGCPNDVIRQAVNAVKEQWRRHVQAGHVEAPNVSKLLDRTISRLDEVEEKLKRVIEIFLDDDQKRL